MCIAAAASVVFVVAVAAAAAKPGLRRSGPGGESDGPLRPQYLLTDRFIGAVF